jgi:hypothetical protein
LLKFATLERDEIVVYTKYDNYTYFRKPIFDGDAEQVTSEDFTEAMTEAKKHPETYYERKY